MPSSPIPAARCHYLLDLLAQVPDPRKRRRRQHPLAGLLAVGIAAVIAGSRSFAAIGQWAADAGPEALAVLGAVRGPAEESTFRRAFALVSADVSTGSSVPGSGPGPCRPAAGWSSLSTARPSAARGTRPGRPRTWSRPSFAVATLLGWHQSGADVQAMLPRLSAYLGPADPRHTYAYLSAAPELPALAAGRLQASQEEQTR